MKKNLIILSMIMSGVYVYSNDFLVIVNKDHNEYEHDKGTTRIETSEWYNINTERCEVDFETNDFYDGVSFVQNKDCEQDQERTHTTIRTYSNGKEVVENVSKEHQTIESNEQFNLVGTHLEESCKNILNNGYSVGSGNYKINITNQPTVYCEMDRQGGGWMLVANYDWNTDNTKTPQNLVRTVNRTISYSGSNMLMLDGWWIPDYPDSNTGNMRWVEVNEQPITKWTQAMFEFEGVGLRSLDEFYNVHNSGISDRSTVNGQYLDGFSFTSGEQGSRKHLYSVPVGYAPMDDEGRLSTSLSWIGNQYDFKDVSQVQPAPYNSNAVYSRNIGNEIVTEIKPESNDKISLRLMADQHYGDEHIGIRKYILWVR